MTMARANDNPIVTPTIPIARARFFMGQVSDRRQDNRSEGASSLQHSSQQYPTIVVERAATMRPTTNNSSPTAITILQPM